ncbi:hypothetical protein CsSME_00019896 [Camellia sinensis var. sinensis]
MSMVLPGVVVFKLSGKLRNGVTATYLVLTVTQMLRKHDVVGKFVEFHGNQTKASVFSSSMVLSMLTGLPLLICLPSMVQQWGSFL